MDGGHHLLGGSEEEVDCRVRGGALTFPFTDFPSGGTCLELEAGEAGDSPIVGSEEEAAMLPSGSEKGSSSSKRKGEVDGGGDSSLEAGARGDSPSFMQLTSPSHPVSGMVPGTRTERSALMMRSASLMNPFTYTTPAVSGVPNTSERGTKTKVAHNLASWLQHPCRLGGPQRFRAGDKISSGQVFLFFGG